MLWLNPPRLQRLLREDFIKKNVPFTPLLNGKNQMRNLHVNLVIKNILGSNCMSQSDCSECSLITLSYCPLSAWKLACSFMSLHACSSMTLYAVPFFVWAAQKNFAVLVDFWLLSECYLTNKQMVKHTKISISWAPVGAYTRCWFFNEGFPKRMIIFEMW